MDSQLRSNKFPGFDRVFMLGKSGMTHPFHVNLELEPDEPCAITRSELRPTRPAVARWFMGRRVPADVFGASTAIPTLVSERVVELLTKIGARGWTTYDVQVFGKAGEAIPGYYGLAVHGRCGPVDFSKPVKVMKKYPGGIFPEWQGFYFDPDTWDGSDVFMTSDGRGVILVVDDVKRAIEKAKLKNFRFKPLTEVLWTDVEMRMNVPGWKDE